MATLSNNIESSNTTDEVELSALELAVLNEIATVVSSATDIGSVYSEFSALVADLIGWDGIDVNTPCDDGRNFIIRVSEGSTEADGLEEELFTIEGSLYGEVLKSQKSQIISVTDGQTAEWALRLPGIRGMLLAGYRSFLATPLISQGKMIGSMCIQSLTSDAFSEHDRLIAENIATFVGPTIERFNSYEELQRDDLHARSLLKIGRLLLSSRDLGDVIEQFVQEMRLVVAVDRLTVAVVHPHGNAVIDRYIHGLAVAGYSVNKVIPLDELELNGLNVNSHGYILPVNALSEADPVTASGLHANYEAGLNSAMFAGLRSEGRLVGTINVKSTRHDAYGASDLEYFEQVADHLAASIDRTLSLESEIEMNRAAEERIRAQQEALRVVDVIQAKERLLSSASHELRTPLTGILAFVDLLARNRDGNLAEKELRYLSIVRRNAEDLSGKVNALIAHAARDAGELNIQLEKFDLATMLREAVTDATPILAETGQVAVLEAPDDFDAIGDRRQLLIAIGHLIDNARRYAPSDSEILITGGQINESIEITVSDQGTGVSEVHESNIFDPFERGELTGMAGIPGAGLGLTYVRAVAVGHGGDALYARAETGGATFTICIPLIAATEL